MFFLATQVQQDGIGLFTELDSLITNLSAPTEVTSSVLEWLRPLKWTTLVVADLLAWVKW